MSNRWDGLRRTCVSENTPYWRLRNASSNEWGGRGGGGLTTQESECGRTDAPGVESGRPACPLVPPPHPCKAQQQRRAWSCTPRVRATRGVPPVGVSEVYFRVTPCISVSARRLFCSTKAGLWRGGHVWRNFDAREITRKLEVCSRIARTFLQEGLKVGKRSPLLEVAFQRRKWAHFRKALVTNF